MSNLENTLGHYPVIGGLVSIGQLCLGYLIQHTIELPPIVMQLFQIGAWFGAMVVSFVTVIGWLKTNTDWFKK